jgi:alkylmercury lyase
MTTPTTAEITNRLEQAGPALSEEDWRLARTATRLLAEGEPLELERLAEALGRPVQEVDQALAKLPWAYRDGNQRLAFFGGLSVAETRHRLHLDDRTLYATCAMDSLFLPPVLGEETRIESTCPTTGQRIALTVSREGVRDVSPPGVVVSFLLPDENGYSDDARRNIGLFCHNIHFFVSHEAAQQWIAQHEGTFELSIQDADELARSYSAQRMFGVHE